MRRKKPTTNARQPTKLPKLWDTRSHSLPLTPMLRKALTIASKVAVGIHIYLQLLERGVSKRMKEVLKFLLSVKSIISTQVVANLTIWLCSATLKGNLTTQLALTYPKFQWGTKRGAIPSNQSTLLSAIFLIPALESSALIQCQKAINNTRLEGT